MSEKLVVIKYFKFSTFEQKPEMAEGGEGCKELAVKGGVLLFDI